MNNCDSLRCTKLLLFAFMVLNVRVCLSPTSRCSCLYEMSHQSRCVQKAQQSTWLVMIGSGDLLHIFLLSQSSQTQETRNTSQHRLVLLYHEGAKNSRVLHGGFSCATNAPILTASNATYKRILGSFRQDPRFICPCPSQENTGCVFLDTAVDVFTLCSAQTNNLLSSLQPAACSNQCFMRPTFIGHSHDAGLSDGLCRSAYHILWNGPLLCGSLKV